MKTTLPGTTIEVDGSKLNDADSILTPLFMAGGLMMSQVSQLTGLEGYVIQNWIKRGFLEPPVNKKYTRLQLCRIFIINMLKDSVQLDKIVSLLKYAGGTDAGELYLYFCKAVYEFDRAAPDIGGAVNKAAITGTLSSADRKKLGAMLRIMMLAFVSSRLQKEAYHELAKLDDYGEAKNLSGGILNDRMVEQSVLN